MCMCDRDEEKHTPVTKNKRTKEQKKHTVNDTSALPVESI